MNTVEVPGIRASVARALRDHPRVLLAVSGGLDSSVLLDAAAASLSADQLIVASFDHGTGDAATKAVGMVSAKCANLGVEFVTARAVKSLRSEASLRDARWKFLRDTARAANAVVCTAHTADDQIETVLMRVLRGAGARGMAGLAAASSVLRPLLGCRRVELREYARVTGVQWVDDPSNADTVYLRNRLRHEVLPALRRVNPAIDRELLDIGARAAAWRVDVDDFVHHFLHVRSYGRRGSLDVDAPALMEFDSNALRVLWPAVAAPAGVTLDRRGMERLVSFTLRSRVGARIHLAGGWEVVRSRGAFELRAFPIGSFTNGNATVATMPLSNETAWGDWLFREAEARERDDHDYRDANWSAWLPTDAPLFVRAWRAGDRLAERGGRERKVKELLTRAGVTGHLRAGWPVVLAGNQIVWVPGAGRSEAATARPGRPGLPFLCEYIHR